MSNGGGLPLEEDREIPWRCGQCGFHADYLVGELPPETCPNCDSMIGERSVTDVPEEVRLRIHR